jgi:hypothetical protein
MSVQKIQDVNDFSVVKENMAEARPEADMQDSQKFEEMLGQNTLDDGSLGSNIMQSFTHMTNNLQYFKNSANTAIKKASMQPDLDNIMKMSYKMHEYGKETSFISRAIAKTTQAVDQLTKLQ